MNILTLIEEGQPEVIIDFVAWMSRANGRADRATEGPLSIPLLHEIFSLTYRGPQVRSLQNPCNCNNMICVLVHHLDGSDIWTQPACKSGCGVFKVHMGPWTLFITSGRNWATGRYPPLSINEFVYKLHKELHEPLEIFELDQRMIPKTMNSLVFEYQTMLRKAGAHYKQRTGNTPDRSGRGLQRIDFLHRNDTGTTGRFFTLSHRAEIQSTYYVTFDNFD
ncbi:uncharacterized protein FOMMEDRAFT_154337 [Fomitiporia mediterranea MF3/22]|uniref:uncharacterized protein n=1 Tax=Fomitiporia mediterranea (strain MF3/22) TaxID=694068 RepID=UPI0004408B66|nr:uncharacterized protein FOMMEDRAFT_154337 [Fomitiporia mediterranea MF3/22]EJD05149.1 hypothetical protein FOMMEDRAFT_154337 [Fomitiporia mediterranea MF3/22]